MLSKDNIMKLMVPLVALFVVFAVFPYVGILITTTYDSLDFSVKAMLNSILKWGIASTLLTLPASLIVGLVCGAIIKFLWWRCDFSPRFDSQVMIVIACGCWVIIFLLGMNHLLT